MLSPTDLEVDEHLDCIPDWPKGPLDKARAKATFNWKLMKLVLDGDSVVRFKHKVWSVLASDPIFERTRVLGGCLNVLSCRYYFGQSERMFG